MGQRSTTLWYIIPSLNVDNGTKCLLINELYHHYCKFQYSHPKIIKFRLATILFLIFGLLTKYEINLQRENNKRKDNGVKSNCNEMLYVMKIINYSKTLLVNSIFDGIDLQLLAMPNFFFVLHSGFTISPLVYACW